MFGKKKKAPQENLQDINGKFNQMLYKLGAAHYRKALLNKQLGDLGNEISALVKEGEELGGKAQALNARIQEEVKLKVADGGQDDKSSTDPA